MKGVTRRRFLDVDAAGCELTSRPSRRRCTRARSCRVQEEHVHADNDALQLQVPGGVFKRGQAAAAAGGSGHALEANAKSVHHSAARWQPAG